VTDPYDLVALLLEHERMRQETFALRVIVGIVLADKPDLLRNRWVVAALAVIEGKEGAHAELCAMRDAEAKRQGKTA
jgi:hypothetical protein